MTRTHSVELLWTSDRPVPGTFTLAHTTLTKYSHASGGIRTHIPNKRVAVDRAAAGVGLYCYLTPLIIKYCKQQYKQMHESQMHYYYVRFPTYLAFSTILTDTILIIQAVPQTFTCRVKIGIREDVRERRSKHVGKK